MATPVKFSTVKVVVKEKRFTDRLLKPGDFFIDRKYVKGKYRKGSVTILPYKDAVKADAAAKVKADAAAKVKADAGLT